MIAPELLVPDEDFVHRVGFQLVQLYESASDPSQIRLPTANFLLFPWTTPGVPFSTRDDEDRWVRNRRLLDDRAGLYLSPDEIMTNTVSMLLPFPIGANGHVLRSDGKISDKASHDALYYHGVCEPSLPYHGTSLHAVLANWWSMVAADDWAVDENGVAGGDSKWRMADTEQYAEAFKIEAACIPPDVDEDGEQESDEAGKESNDVGDEELDSSAKESVRTEDGDKPEREE
jgi:hypothetical protein